MQKEAGENNLWSKDEGKQEEQRNWREEKVKDKGREFKQKKAKNYTQSYWTKIHLQIKNKCKDYEHT